MSRRGELMINTVPALHSASLSIEAFSRQSAKWQNSVLGAICFSIETDDRQMLDAITAPCTRVPMQRLDADETICEVWYSNGPLTQGQSGDIQYRYNDDVLFGLLTLPETWFAASEDMTPLQQATEAAYNQVFALLDALHYPHLIRFWNYIADINGTSFGLERYRQFNLGRQAAFLSHSRDIVGNVPAACALGSTQGPLTIAFLAGRVAPVNIENPRQVSAYQYPQQYGPCSPTFSRASLVRLGQDEVLFISGTASIIGHISLHPTDVVAQTRETMANIEAVLAEANSIARQPPFYLPDLHYKVYARNPADLAEIRLELARCVGCEPNAVYLQADVCRQDLLLEIEATAWHPFLPIPGKLD